ncbi:hypothetical protein B0T20DRAFT_412169 [Sordaria brevicollis]|uniref:Uncharacterized protein n=1 Tax=Sordaria brevicollis TaxID=83679 RepID=A0AAE0UCB1_SORBR|nr:hypothetical protein B0T20DRAFT_412169 [Sordaria brevicollis]
METWIHRLSTMVSLLLRFPPLLLSYRVQYLISYVQMTRPELTLPYYHYVVQISLFSMLMLMVSVTDPKTKPSHVPNVCVFAPLISLVSVKGKM